MKNANKIFLAIVFIFFGFVALSQTNMEKTSAADDKNARSVLASYYLEIPVNFDSPTAEACVNLLLNAHRNSTAYPVLPIEKLSGTDKEKVEKLKNELIALRNNPPTWEIILASEEAKLAPNYSAPTAPVFAGNLGRPNMNLSKNKVHIVNASGNTENFKVVEQNIQNK